MEQTKKPTLDLSFLETLFRHGELSNDPAYSHTVASVAELTLGACNASLSERLHAVTNDQGEDTNYAIARASEIERLQGIIDETMKMLKDKQEKYYNEIKKEEKK